MAKRYKHFLLSRRRYSKSFNISFLHLKRAYGIFVTRIYIYIYTRSSPSRILSFIQQCHFIVDIGSGLLDSIYFIWCVQKGSLSSRPSHNTQYPLGPRGYRCRWDNVFSTNDTTIPPASISHFIELITFIAQAASFFFNRWNFHSLDGKKSRSTCYTTTATTCRKWRWRSMVGGSCHSRRRRG